MLFFNVGDENFFQSQILDKKEILVLCLENFFLRIKTKTILFSFFLLA